LGLGVEVDDAAGDRGTLDRVAGGDGEDGPHQFGSLGALE
jgi:hypothetical protein